MSIEKTHKIGLLYDYYGQLLTPKQSRIFELYYEEDLTLAEISERLKITRQAVHDSLKNTEALFNEYELKLGLMEESKRRELLLEKIYRELDGDADRLKIDSYLREIGV